MGSMKTTERGRTMRTVPGERTGTPAGGPGGRVEAPGPGKCRPGPAGGGRETRSRPAHTQAVGPLAPGLALARSRGRLRRMRHERFQRTLGAGRTPWSKGSERALQPRPLPTQRCEPQHEKEPSAGRPATAEKPSIRTPGVTGRRTGSGTVSPQRTPRRTVRTPWANPE